MRWAMGLAVMTACSGSEIAAEAPSAPGEVSDRIAVIYSARGDGEIEPCG